MTSISLYLGGLAKLAYSWLVAPLVLNLTHYGLDKVGACATAQSADRSDEQREALATASDVAVERVAPVLGVAAAAAGVALVVGAHGYTLVGVGTRPKCFRPSRHILLPRSYAFQQHPKDSMTSRAAFAMDGTIVAPSRET